MKQKVRSISNKSNQTDFVDFLYLCFLDPKIFSIPKKSTQSFLPVFLCLESGTVSEKPKEQILRKLQIC